MKRVFGVKRIPGLKASLEENLAQVRERIAHAARRAGRDPADITLVGITKTHPVEVIEAAIEAGLTHLGENRVQEAAEKIPHVRGRASWHMVGHLQSNKVRQALPLFDSLDGIDSLSLAEEIARRAEEPVRLLLQVNVSGERSKRGFAPLELHRALPRLIELSQLRIEGLMTLAPLVRDPEETRPVFRGLARLREELRHHYPELPWATLSMGMSQDFEVAIEEGATMIRIGTALFGARQRA